MGFNMIYAKAGTKEQLTGDSLPVNITKQEVLGENRRVLEEEAKGVCLFIEMDGEQPTPDHYAIDGKWLLLSEFI